MLTTTELEQELSIVNEKWVEQYQKPINELHKEEQQLEDIRVQLLKEHFKLTKLLKVSIIMDQVGELTPGDVLLSEYEDLYILFNGWMSKNIFILFSEHKKGSMTIKNKHIKIKVNDITLYQIWDISNSNFWRNAKDDLFNKITKIGNIY